METYIAIIDQTNSSSGVLYGAFVPDVPDCTVMGTSLESVVAEMKLLLRRILLRELRSGGVLPKAKPLDELVAEYTLAGEDLLSPNSSIVMLEVSYTVFCSARRVAVAA
jgi:predicted RNase H-like HicB family nuclease